MERTIMIYLAQNNYSHLPIKIHALQMLEIKRTSCTEIVYMNIHRCVYMRLLSYMLRCAYASEVYGSVCVCVCVCVDCYSCSRINEVQVRVLFMFSWMHVDSWICKTMLACMVLE